MTRPLRRRQCPVRLPHHVRLFRRPARPPVRVERHALVRGHRRFPDKRRLQPSQLCPGRIPRRVRQDEPPVLPFSRNPLRAPAPRPPRRRRASQPLRAAARARQRHFRTRRPVPRRVPRHPAPPVRRQHRVRPRPRVRAEGRRPGGRWDCGRPTRGAAGHGYAQSQRRSRVLRRTDSAVGAPYVPGQAVEMAAAVHAVRPRRGAGGIGHGPGGGSPVIPVQTPFRHVPVHVEEAPGVRPVAPHLRVRRVVPAPPVAFGGRPVVEAVPRHLRHRGTGFFLHGDSLVAVQGPERSRPARILPLRLRRQVERQPRLRPQDPDEAPRVHGRRGRPPRPRRIPANHAVRDALHRTCRPRITGGIVPRRQLPLPLRHLEHPHPETFRQRDLVLHFVQVASGLVRRRPHRERPRVDPAQHQLVRLVFVRPAALWNARQPLHRPARRRRPTAHVHHQVRRIPAPRRQLHR